MIKQSNNAISAGNQQERLPDISTDYIVGIVDGEGYFSISPRRRKINSKEVIEIDCVFGIDLKEIDKPILERIKQKFNCGKLYFRRDLRKNFCNLWSFRVRAHQELLEKVVPFFQDNPLQIPSKRKSFKTFEQVLMLIKQGKHQTEKGFAQIKELVDTGRILRDYTPNASKEDDDIVHAL
jgi:hypothetical protein